MTMLAHRAWSRPEGRAWWGLTLLSALGVWASYPLIFVATGIGAALGVRVARPFSRRRHARLARLHGRDAGELGRDVRRDRPASVALGAVLSRDGDVGGLVPARLAPVDAALVAGEGPRRQHDGLPVRRQQLRQRRDGPARRHRRGVPVEARPWTPAPAARADRAGARRGGRAPLSLRHRAHGSRSTSRRRSACSRARGSPGRSFCPCRAGRRGVSSSIVPWLLAAVCVAGAIGAVGDAVQGPRRPHLPRSRSRPRREGPSWRPLDRLQRPG